MTVAARVAQLLRGGVSDIALIAEGAGTTRANAGNVLRAMRLRRLAKMTSPGKWEAIVEKDRCFYTGRYLALQK
jgi:hypothetical protein